MKIWVPVKRVIDYRVKVRLKSDKSSIEMQSVKHSMNPFDEIALEEALRLQELGFASEVIAVSCGDKSTHEVLKVALAMGAGRAVQIESAEPFAPAQVAKAIARIVQKEGGDCVILGKQAIDNDCNQVGQMLAGYLSWPQATFASQILCDKNGQYLTVTREIDSGLQIIRVTLPAVVTTDLRLNTPRFVSLPNIMKAKAKLVDVISCSDLGVTTDSAIRHVSYAYPEERKKGKMLESVEEVIDILNKEVMG